MSHIFGPVVAGQYTNTSLNSKPTRNLKEQDKKTLFIWVHGCNFIKAIHISRDISAYTTCVYLRVPLKTSAAVIPPLTYGRYKYVTSDLWPD